MREVRNLDFPDDRMGLIFSQLKIMVQTCRLRFTNNSLNH